jgi:hypothetical protein
VGPEEDEWGCKGLQGTAWIVEAARGPKGPQRVLKGHKWIQVDTRGHNGTRGHKGTQGDTRGHKGTQGDTRGHKGTQGDTRGHKRSKGVAGAEKSLKRLRGAIGDMIFTTSVAFIAIFQKSIYVTPRRENTIISTPPSPKKNSSQIFRRKVAPL